MKASDYHVSSYWSQDEGLFIARCDEIPCCIGYNASSRETAEEDARQAIEEHLEYRDELLLEHPPLCC